MRKHLISFIEMVRSNLNDIEYLSEFARSFDLVFPAQLLFSCDVLEKLLSTGGIDEWFPKLK